MLMDKREPELWHLLPAEPGIEASFKRWNFVVISVLLFVLLGVLVVGLGSEALYSPLAGRVAPQPTHHTVHHA